MEKMKEPNTEVNDVVYDKKDYIYSTHIMRYIENGLALIEKRLCNKNTIEFFGISEEMYNSVFNFPGFEEIKKETGLNAFTLSPGSGLKQ